jgi:uncharacterized iron-regulated membrane protein
MKRIRRVVFWCHLPAGVIAGLVILVMSLTGAVLAFEKQVVRFADRDLLSTRQPTNGRRLGIRALFAELHETNPELTPISLTVRADPSASAWFAVSRNRLIYVDPYTGKILGQGSIRLRAAFNAITDLHRWLGARQEGRSTLRAITGACNAAFLGLAITGVFLWLPRSWSRQSVIAASMFKRGLNGRARDFNWHNVTGIWCAAILVVISATGVVMSYKWANDLLFRLTGSEAPPLGRATTRGVERPKLEGTQFSGRSTAPSGARPLEGSTSGQPPREYHESEPQTLQSDDSLERIDQLWWMAEQQIAEWRSITVRPPSRPGEPVIFLIEDERTLNPSARSQLTLHHATGEILSWEPYQGWSSGRKLRSWVRVLHTGEAGGMLGQFVAFTASIGGAVLVWTGLALGLRRLRTWVARRQAASAARY